MGDFRASAQGSSPGGGSTSAAGKPPIRVMVVDDALVIRGMLSRIIEAEPEMEVVASVGDGERALRSLERHDVDVVILDIEMPRMDGLTALPKIVELSPNAQVLMASTLTLRNAEISMKAMSLGAADYLPKPTSSGELRNADEFRRDLVSKVRSLGRTAQRRKRMSARTGSTGAGRSPVGGQGGAAQRPFRVDAGRAGAARPRTERPASPKPDHSFSLHSRTDQVPEIIAIGSSTGGPQALFQVLKGLGPDVKQPILITQHMPATFTTILAQHIEKASGRPAHEGKDGETITPGTIYVAPGDHHMVVEVKGGQKIIRINDDPPENFCRPAVDPMLRSISAAYGKRVLVVILTGMGSDGRKGAEVVVKNGGETIAQDEATSVVWGMPGATAMAGVCSAVLPLDQIGPQVRAIAMTGAPAGSGRSGGRA